ncbi:uncharacterized protein LOC142532828 isoform X2 [Primulina tabacum]|uniref:uncharacterized protein LOC142532828 isoform X2 n=1 Tax=Primulina tabacum TaxID=48773 RepID=UPI003F5A94F5
MGSVGFSGDSESQPSTSNSKKLKSPTKLLDECCAVNHAAIPRKLRSAVRKRVLESMTPALPISKKQNRGYDGIETLRKRGAKKSKLNTKQGHVSKDEKEVAETLYLLADMFYDAIKNDEQGLDVHPTETNSLTLLEMDSTMTAAQDAGKIAGRVTLEAICQTSKLEDSTSKIAQLKSFDDPQLSKLPISKQYPIPFVSGDGSDLVTGSSRTKMPALITVPSDWGITVEQAAAPGIQNCLRENKNNDLLIWRPSLSSTGTQGTETLESCPRSSADKLPAWFETTNHIIQHRTPKEKFTKNKHHLVEVEPMRLRKRCSAHVYISYLIKVMQVLDRKEGLPETRFEPGPHISIDYQKNGIDYTSGDLSSSVSSIRDTILLHKSVFQDQLQISKIPVSCSPLMQDSDFLSFAGHSEEALKQFRSSFMQSQNNLAMLLSHPKNCYSTFHDRSSSVATQQLLPFHSSRLGDRVAALFPDQSHPAGFPTSYLPDWKNGERDSSFFVNCSQAQSLFPHLHSTPGLKYHQFPQQRFNTIHPRPSLSNVKGHSLRLSSGFDRNRATCNPGNMSQLQIFCNQQHL